MAKRTRNINRQASGEGGTVIIETASVAWGPDFGGDAGNDGITIAAEASMGDIDNYGIGIDLPPDISVDVTELSIEGNVDEAQSLEIGNIAINDIRTETEASLGVANIHVDGLDGGTSSASIDSTTLVYNYSNAGASTFTVPTNATSVLVEVWGGGGGGGNQFVGVASGGGGGGGEYARIAPTYTTGLTYNLLVGSGGGTETAGTSTLYDSTQAVANGGGPGATGAAGGQGTGGTGGSGGSGDTTFVGGNGAGGGGLLDLTGGGGGGAGGSTEVGEDAASNVGGAGGDIGGGDGANGSVLLGAPSAAGQPGGGGGGTSSTTLSLPSSGADGRITITVEIAV